MKIVFLIAAICAATWRLAYADHIDDVISAQMKKRQIPGVALAVIKDGTIVREQAYGFRDEAHTQPVTSDTLFQAASVSKPVTALAALHLVEQGRVSLDEDIKAKLRSWHIPDNRFTKGSSGNIAADSQPWRWTYSFRLSRLRGRRADTVAATDFEWRAAGKHAARTGRPSPG